MADKIAASIEISPKQALEAAELPGLFPKGVRVYMTDVGTDPEDNVVAGAARIAELGYIPVPHFASRRLTSREALESRIRRLAGEAGVNDVLVIGGGLDHPAGDFTSTMEVLETGFFDKYGIKHIGIAGHPEGSPDFSEETANDALKLKKAFAEHTGARMRIVTQFGFDPDKFIRWADGLKRAGIDLPVHLGVAGPAKITTLVRFAVMCGVGASTQFIKKRAASIGTLVMGFDPEEIVAPIEEHVTRTGDGCVEQIHVFPFGGLKKSAAWLKERGSWA